jgi:hypothetical protein
MPPEGFEPTIAVGERPQMLNSAVITIGVDYNALYNRKGLVFYYISNERKLNISSVLNVIGVVTNYNTTFCTK